jgi:hypothetical protein
VSQNVSANNYIQFQMYYGYALCSLITSSSGTQCNGEFFLLIDGDVANRKAGWPLSSFLRLIFYQAVTLHYSALSIIVVFADPTTGIMSEYSNVNWKQCHCWDLKFL